MCDLLHFKKQNNQIFRQIAICKLCMNQSVYRLCLTPYTLLWAHIYFNCSRVYTFQMTLKSCRHKCLFFPQFNICNNSMWSLFSRFFDAPSFWSNALFHLRRLSMQNFDFNAVHINMKMFLCLFLCVMKTFVRIAVDEVHGM